MVLVAMEGKEGLTAAEGSEFDALVLDVMLPVLDGFLVAKRLRAAGNRVPILMLTGRDSNADIVRGLDAGADDYLTKPFSFEVLIARLRALTRRRTHSGSESLHVSDLFLDPATHVVRRGGMTINLTRTEFGILECLVNAPRRTRCSPAGTYRGGLGLRQGHREQHS